VTQPGQEPHSTSKAPSKVYYVNWREDGKTHGMAFWTKVYAESLVKRLQEYGARNVLLRTASLDWSNPD
jgi:hypothetical protein